jgi:anaerobic ribonucleoside-triphosphate reductase activating protein
MTDIHFHSIIPRSYVDGPGERTVLFTQGCSIGCAGCQNRHLWDPQAGRVAPVVDVAQTILLLSANGQFTLSGGEPFQQASALYELLVWLRSKGPTQTHIIVYSGYEWAHLYRKYPHLLWLIDVLVDGPFIQDQDDDFVAWRGSRNQRPIDVFKSLLSEDPYDPVVLDWDGQATITPAGDLVLPAGLVDFFPIGQPAHSPMCGQTRRRA